MPTLEAGPAGHEHEDVQIPKTEAVKKPRSVKERAPRDYEKIHQQMKEKYLLDKRDDEIHDLTEKAYRKSYVQESIKEANRLFGKGNEIENQLDKLDGYYENDPEQFTKMKFQNLQDLKENLNKWQGYLQDTVKSNKLSAGESKSSQNILEHIQKSLARLNDLESKYLDLKEKQKTSSKENSWWNRTKKFFSAIFSPKTQEEESTTTASAITDERPQVQHRKVISEKEVDQMAAKLTGTHLPTQGSTILTESTLNTTEAQKPSEKEPELTEEEKIKWDEYKEKMEKIKIFTSEFKSRLLEKYEKRSFLELKGLVKDHDLEIYRWIVDSTDVLYKTDRKNISHQGIDKSMLKYSTPDEIRSLLVDEDILKDIDGCYEKLNSPVNYPETAKKSSLPSSRELRMRAIKQSEKLGLKKAA